MNKLDITIDPDENLIRVWNNGKGIPVVVHKEHNIYVPELIFGNLLTGSNFDDNQEKTTGGRNGFGAKLANIFSTEFTVETADSNEGLKFKQVFSKNMSQREAPIVSKYSGSDYTCISFKPDLEKFKMPFLDDDTVSLLCKRAYDFAGTSNSKGPKLNVFLNGKKIEAKNFEQYINLYQGIEKPIGFERPNERWEIGFGVSDGTFQQVSFVNSICTIKGGTHVNYIADQATARLVNFIKKKNKGTEVKASQIKNHLAVYVNCLVTNPSFDSQTKDFLTTKVSALGSKCEVTEKMLKMIEKSDIVDHVLNWAKFKQNNELKKKGGAKKAKILGISKLDDANFAGTSRSKDCTLILTEGDSAKALAMSGIGVVGRDYYGAFPLKGKLLNVREAPHAQILKNEEIQNIAKILGLQFGKKYTDTSSLRYGHLMIMADQDHDGSHIKGLLINFLHFYWPSLLDIPGFLQQFITPIVKCTKGKKEEVFFTLPQYETWKNAQSNANAWRIKYYKGLGTSTASEAKAYFSNLATHEIDFHWNDNTDNVLDLAFAKKRVDDRKSWLLGMEAGTYVDYNVKSVAYDTFVNRELILFSHADNARSIPHFMDGMKPSQRKVLYSCFKKKLQSELKVAQLAGYIAEKSCYHHGEASLTQTIIGMAQNFVGSNNINLLSPCGQFGTRAQGGKDAASPRYVFTKLEPITRCIFHPDDDAILNYLDDDGTSIEPESYMPIIPMLLVNGTDGIGTGWSTSVPTYNPRDLIENLRRKIRGEMTEEMHPWYRGFHGDIRPKDGRDAGNYSMYGNVEQIDDSTILVTELPIGKWTQDYKQFLESMVIGGPGAAEGAAAASMIVKDFKENHTDTTVLFTVTLPAEKLVDACNEKGGIHKKFKLETSISTSNMHAFNFENQIQKFENVEEIMNSFFHVRLEYYEKRKAYLVGKFKEEWDRLDNKVRFILAVINETIVVSNRKRDELLQELKSKGFKTFMPVKKTPVEEEDAAANAEAEEAENDLAKGYDYLLSMKLWNLTMEKVQTLTGERDAKRAQLDELEATAASDIWLSDLDRLEEALDEFEEQFEIAAAEEEKARLKAGNGSTRGKAKVAAKKKTKKKHVDSDEESDADYDDDDDSDFEDKKPKVSAAKKVKVAAGPVAGTGTKIIAPQADAKPMKKERSKQSSSSLHTSTTSVVAAPAPKIVKEEPVEELSLAARLMNRMKIGLANQTFVVDPAPVSAPAPAKTTGGGTKRPPKAKAASVTSPEKSPDIYSASAFAASYSPGTPADKPSKKVKAVSNKPTGAASKKSTAPATKKLPLKKKKTHDSDEEDALFDDNDSEDSVSGDTPVAPRAMPARARKPVVYDAGNDTEDDENESDVFDEDEDNDDSDFE